MGAPVSPVLRIRDLSVGYRHGNSWVRALRDVSLRIDAGQTLGLVGESGSGKSTLALAVMGYLSEGGMICEGAIQFLGRDLLSLSADEMRHVWASQLALVPQEPLSSLNPSIRVGEQLAEALRQHRGMDRATALQESVRLLGMVRLADPDRIARSFPHQLSGGMQQRVLIAMALSTEPALLVLDEPTTGLDVTTEAAVLDLFRDLIRVRNTSALYVTHNLGVVARICDRVAVLYASELVEEGPTGELYRQALHPYTAGLLRSVPTLGQSRREMRLQAIEGSIPTLTALPPSCVFEPRCPLAIDVCRVERPSIDVLADGRRVRCHRWREILAGRAQVRESPVCVQVPAILEAEPVVETHDLRVHYRLTRDLVELITARPPKTVKAIDGVGLAVEEGRTLGLVGESGSGKTTFARAILGLSEASGGEVELRGVRLPRMLSRRDKDTLRSLQVVFQNPDEALNPHLTVGESLSRPLITLLGLSGRDATQRVDALLTSVRLPLEYAERRPGQLSGGERQRVAIARALAAEPEVLICDEPVSALDVSVQAAILELLHDLQAERGVSILFIAHDISVVSYLADEVAVLYLGHLMQWARTDDLLRSPFHPYTEALLSAVPIPDPSKQQRQIILEGDVPSPVDVPTGCPFHPRCPRFLGELCVRRRPPWRVGDDGKRVFCHIPLDQLQALQDSVRETVGRGALANPC
jgi:peptide/nickel transport system ATP-binding protein